MRPSFWDYVREAFNARPIGMFVPPNWVALAAAGLFAAAQPDPAMAGGVLALAAGAELGYLAWLSNHPRFQRFVAGKMSAGATNDAAQRAQALIDPLSPADRQRYERLRTRCLAILKQQFGGQSNAPGYAAQSDSLGRLTWTYLRLLATRVAIQRVVSDAPRAGEPPPLPGGTSSRLEMRLAELKRRVADPALREELRHSLESQVELLEQRLARRAEADQKIAFLDAELARIEEQVELIREQAVLSTDPEHFSRRIDEISATLGSTGQWIADQQQVLGTMDDLISEPPPLTAQTRARESN